MKEAAEEFTLPRFLQQALRGEDYLILYPDVAALGLDPYQHWLRHGMAEGRRLPGLDILRGPAAECPPGAEWQQFTWRGEPVAIRPAAPLPPAILAQIKAQARHDPVVLAPGAKALSRLRQIEATNIRDRDGIDVPKLLSQVPGRPEVVVVLTRLTAGVAERYAADLTDVLAAESADRILIVVTEQTSAAASAWKTLAGLAPFRAADVVFWQDACGAPGYADPVTLARVLNALRPRLIVVAGSRLGLDVVARFGRGLSRFARIACLFPGMDVDAPGAHLAMLFTRRTMPFALVLTDNEPMAERLRRLYDGIDGPGIALLPPRVQPTGEEAFAARLAARRAHVAARIPDGRRRWACMARVGQPGGAMSELAVLFASLSEARPDDRFEMFGASGSEAAASGLRRPNILMCGHLPDAAAELAGYDGFLFAGGFTGIPSLLLEVSQHAIPMVLAEGSGLCRSLGKDAAILVPHGMTPADRLAGFGHALDHLAALGPEETVGMAVAARTQVLASYGPAAHARAVAALFDLFGSAAP